MRYLSYVLKYPKSIISGLILCTLLFAWQIPSIEVDTNIKNMIPRDFPVIESLDRLEDILGGSEIIVIGVESEDLWSTKTLDKLSQLQEDLEYFEEASKVMSLFTAMEFESAEDGFEVVDLMPYPPETNEEVEELKRRIRDNDLVYGALVSKDFKKLAFIVQLVRTSDIDDDVLRQRIADLAESYRGPEKVYISGLPFTRAQVQVDMQGDMKRFMPFGLLLMIVLLAIAFRSWIGVFLPLVVVIVSVIWTFGVMSLFGIKFTFISMLIPVMLIAIANDYGIHIITHYFHESRVSKTASNNDIIHRVISRLGWPILLAGLTTIIGFMSLLSHVMTDARKIGILASFGILLAFILSLVLIPAILSVLGKPEIASGRENGQLFTSILRKWIHFFTVRPKLFLLLVGIVMVVIGWRIPSVVVDTDPNHYYQEDSSFRIQNEVISDEFGGSAQLSVFVEGDIKDPVILNSMLEVSQYLETKPHISEVVSIADQIARMNEAFNGGDINFRVIPDNRDLIAQYLLLYSITGDASDLERFVDYEYEHAQILVRIDRVSSSDIKQLLDEINEYIQTKQNPAVFTSVTGFGAIMGILVEILVRGQIISLLVSIFLVFAVTSVVFKSAQGGLFAVMPLAMSIIMVFGLMGYLRIELNAATVMLSSIMIGVGVDYTIHFLWHLREAIRSGESLEKALDSTMVTSGRGIFFNALSVIVGFAVLLVSAFLPITFFGFLIVFSIGMCLFGALAVLPAIVVTLKPKFLYKPASIKKEGQNG